MIDQRSVRTSEHDLRARWLVDRFWDRFLELNPVFGTHAGDERFDDRLPDPSERGLEERDRLARWALHECGEIDPGTVGPETRRALEMVRSLAERDLAYCRHRFDRFWAVSQMAASYLFGPSQLLAEIGSLQRADTPERLERYLARLGAVPTYLRGVTDVLRGAIADGQVAPVIVVDRAVQIVQDLLQGGPERSTAMDPVVEAEPRDRQRVAEALRRAVFPAYGTYLEALRRYRPSARETTGLCALPGGEEMYAAEISGWTTLEIGIEELHRLGRETLDALAEEGRRIAEELGHADPRAALTAHADSGEDTPSSREQVLGLARAQVGRSWDAAPAFFGRMPAKNCEVRAVDPSLEGHILDYYLGPSEDGTRPGVFYVNCASRPLHSMATTTYHESNPGHHFQAMVDLEAPDRPAIRRYGNELQGLAFSEGWGLYSERLADEMGLYVDAYERLGMLELQALRAARLVVDTGIHAFGWSRDRAIALLEATGQPDWKAAAEVDRYVAMPGQALCYTVGRREIERLRSAAGADRDRTSLRAFHDRLLALGALPLPTITAEMNADAD